MAYLISEKVFLSLNPWVFRLKNYYTNKALSLMTESTYDLAKT